MRMTHSEQGKISILQFAIIAVLLIVLLVGGTYIGVRRIAHNTPQTQPIATDNKTQDQASEKKKAEAEQKKQQEAVKKQQAADKKKAEQAAKAAEEKKRLEQAAVDAAQRQTQQRNANPQAPTPSTVASTGPEDTLIAIIGIAALSYAGYSFVQSRKTLSSRRG